MAGPRKVLPSYLPFSVNTSDALYRDRCWSKEEENMIQVRYETIKEAPQGFTKYVLF